MSLLPRDLFVSASDGLHLHVREFGAQSSTRLSVVCLPGLARTTLDFEALAMDLSASQKSSRRVIALDYRGRGKSQWDVDWRHYDVRVELDDVLQVLTALNIGEAVIVGTSRGGLIAMALAAARPALLRGVVLNDIGPVIEKTGLERIRGYVGKVPTPADMAEGAQILKRLSESAFPAFSDQQWETMARGTWTEQSGKLQLAYDPALMKSLEDFKDKAPPALWHLFAGLKDIPVLVLRGEHSDLLSEETATEMRRMHPDLETITVPGQGHAPLLEGSLNQRIADFVERCESLDG